MSSGNLTNLYNFASEQRKKRTTNYTKLIKMRSLIFILALGSILVSFTLTTEISSISYTIDKSTKITIEGTSNVHDWVAHVNKVTGGVEFGVSDDGLIRINECNVNIDVESIKSEKGSIMDNKMFKALKGKEHPSITFKLKSIGSMEKTSSGFKSKVYGYLTVAGTTKVIGFDVVGTELANGNYEVKGSEKLKMTSYNVDPPTAMMGAMTTGDDITIKFQTILVQK